MKKQVYAVMLYCIVYAMLAILLSVGWANWLRHAFDGLGLYIDPSIQFALGIALQSFVLLVMLVGIFSIIVYKKNSLQHMWTHIHKNWRRKGWWPLLQYSVWGLLLYMFINGVLFYFLTRIDLHIPWLYGQQAAISLIQGIVMSNRRDYRAVWTMVVLLGPLVEEIIYRWFITDILVKEYSWYWAIVSAAIFALSHGEPAVLINLFILSLFLNYIYMKTASLWYTIAFHVFINWLAFVALYSMQ